MPLLSKRLSRVETWTLTAKQIARPLGEEGQQQQRGPESTESLMIPIVVVAATEKVTFAFIFALTLVCLRMHNIVPREFKYRTQIYPEFDPNRGERRSSGIYGEISEKRLSRGTHGSSRDDSYSAAEQTFSAHRFDSSSSGGHANSLYPPAAGAPFTDLSSPITTPVRRYKKRRPVSFPLRSPDSPGHQGFKVEKERDKGTSMMAFWAQGEKTTSDAQKDKNRAAMLQHRLEEMMEQLLMERKYHQEKESRYEELLRQYEEQNQEGAGEEECDNTAI